MKPCYGCGILSELESRDVLEIADARYDKGFTILCSQFDAPGWMEQEQVPNKLTEDAICDRFALDSHKLIIAGDDSMRKQKRRHFYRNRFQIRVKLERNNAVV